MKQILYAAVIATLLFSCKSKKTEDTADSLAVVPVDSTQLLIEKFKPIIQGVWVKSDYIKKVMITKSPFAAADKATGITVLYIDTTKIKGDSLEVGAGFNNHEGGSIILKFKPGKSPASLFFDDGELSYSVENRDTVLTISKLNADNGTTEVNRYIRALKKTDDKLGDGMDYLINKNLLSGRYNMTDTIGKVSSVTFLDNGKVSGIPGLRTYYVLNDFIGDPMNNLDQLIFNLYAKDQTTYSFKITADTLRLYSTKANADSSELILDKLAYKLVRAK